MVNKFNLILAVMILFSLMNIVSISSLSVAVHVPEKYTDVTAGERFYFEIEVKYPENPQRKDLRLEYEIFDSEENLIAHSKVLKAVETQASFMDFIVIPESAEKGLHIVKVKVSDYEELSEEVEASFHIKSGTSVQIRMYFFILLGTIILVGLLVIASIFFRKK